MKVSDLIAALEDCDPEGEVRVGVPQHPREAAVDRVEEVVGSDPDSTVYLSLGW
jgi:hypothetical protein